MRRATCHGRLLWVLRQEAATASAYEQQIYTNRSAGWQASPAGDSSPAGDIPLLCGVGSACPDRHKAV